ncbi:MAG: DNA polymerase IV [Acidimicrobiales bacterium]|nr:DNA polymerase IV [Acidimicrobiales bacterium]
MTGGQDGAGEADGLGVLHVDMDAFYVSVEVQANPALAGKPVVVGGQGPRGVVASCSYEARRYGIHSAMPTMRARHLCPEAVFLPGRHDTYAEVSRRLHGVLGRFTPLVEGIGLDEAFLDVRGARRLFGSPPEMAWAIRGAVAAQLGLSCSVGVARSKLLAKLASKRAKPTLTDDGIRPGPGVVVVWPDQELAFLHPLPVGALWGVGPKTADRLGRLGVVTVGDLAALPEETLVSSLGRAMGRQLHQLAWARDPRPVEPARPPKSIRHEEPYPDDVRDLERLRRQVVRMADAVCDRARAQGLRGRTVTLKVRFASFSTITRSRTLAEPTGNAQVVAATAGGLLSEVDISGGVRLLGVGLSVLAGDEVSPRQLSLEEIGGGDGERHLGNVEQAQAAIDAVRARFGTGAVGPAVLLSRGGDGSSRLDVKRPGDTQWGPSSG